MLTIEWIIAILVLGSQFASFFVTIRRIRIMRDLFPQKALDTGNVKKTAREDRHTGGIIINNTQYNAAFIHLVTLLNQYLQKNEGAADFKMMENIVESQVAVYQEDLSSRITLPLYIGLIGTFSGVILGMQNISHATTIDEGVIRNFIGGVITAMCASLVGLSLTVCCNAWFYKRAKGLTDSRKNEFFNFLRVHLLPYLGSDLANVVNTFKDNIAHFNKNFGDHIQLFDEKLSDNIKHLDKSVMLIAGHISPLVANTSSNYKILEELSSFEFKEIVKTNVSFTKTLAQAIPKLEAFTQRQDDLNEAIHQTAETVMLIASVMDRVKRFEEGINRLGERIDNADYMSADLLDKVNKELDDLDKRFKVLKRHSQEAAGKVEVHFLEEKHKIEALSKTALHKLQNSLPFDEQKNPLMKLGLLESIDTRLNDIQTRLHANEDVKKLAADMSTTKTHVSDINHKLSRPTRPPASMPRRKTTISVRHQKKQQRRSWLSKLLEQAGFFSSKKD